MGNYYVSNNDKVQEYIKNKLGDVSRTVDVDTILDLIYGLKVEELLSYIPSSEWYENRYGDEGILNSRPDKSILLDNYRTNGFNTTVTSLIFVLSNMGYTKIDYTSISSKEKYPLNKILNSAPYVQKMTFIGNFQLSRSIESKLKKCCSKIIIDGSFELRNIHSSREIELPSTLKLPPFSVINSRLAITKYESTNEYINRPERLKRLAKNKKVRNVVKEANDSGVLTFTDVYGIPLEVGCTVACKSYSCCIGEIVGQTSKQIKVKVMGNNDVISRMNPEDIVRIR